MSTPVSEPEARATVGKPRALVRTISFRVLAILWALVLLVMFGAATALITPWVVLPDTIDHGWTRTAELHRVADSAAAVLMAATAVALIVLAVRPGGRSAMAAWAATSLTVMGVLVPISALLQGQGVLDAVITAAVWLALVAVTFLLRGGGRTLARGGTRDDRMPSRPLRTVFAVGVALGVTLVIGAIGWRLAGGVFESVREDDVVGFVNLGVSFAVGCVLCRAGREGWRPLAVILAGIAAYAMAGGVTIALT